MDIADAPGGRTSPLPPGHSFAPKGLRQVGRRAPAWLLGIAVAVSLFGLLPLVFVFGAAVEIGWDTVQALVFRPRVGELLINTFLLIVLAVPLSVVVGVGLAWLTERTDLPGRRAWSLVMAAPLAVPAFVHSYAWVSFVPSIHGAFAGVLITVLAYFPFLYLPCAATLRRLDPTLEDVAASLGDPPLKIFFRVVLPQLRLAIWGGALLIGLHLLAEYGLYAMIRFDTFTTAIFDQFQSSFSGPGANTLAGVLVLLCLLLLAVEGGTRGGARYARLGAGTARQPGQVRLGPAATLLCLCLPLAMALLSLGVPFLTLIRWLMIGGAKVWRVDDLVPALLQTLTYAGLGAALITLAAVPMAWLSIRAPSRAIRLLEGINYVCGSLPGIVAALALVALTIRVAQPLYQTVFTVILAYLLMFLPRALISLRASIAQAPVELENVAASLGRAPLRVLAEVTLRLAAPGAAAGAALVFLAIVNELTATLLLAPSGTLTLATQFWALVSELDYAGAAPYASIMVLLSLPITWILHHQSRRVAGR
jgi:iron(III) transport system permease protein